MNRFDMEKILTQIVVHIPGQNRLAIGPFTWDQEPEVEKVYQAWLDVKRAATNDRPGYEMTVTLHSYVPTPPSTDVGWMYSQYVQPHLPPRG